MSLRATRIAVPGQQVFSQPGTGVEHLETLDNEGVAHRCSARLTNVIVAAIPESSWDTR
jgi:hypothetical protein